MGKCQELQLKNVRNVREIIRVKISVGTLCFSLGIAVILLKFALGLSFLYMTFITLLTQLILREFGKNFGNPGVLKILDV